MAQLTSPECYPRAIVLYSLGGNAAFFAGPMVAGLLISGFGTSGAYAANALADLPVIAVAVTLPASKTRPIEPGPREGAVRQMRAGLAYVVRNRTIFVMLLSFSAVAVTARGIMELSPSIASTVLDGDLKTLSLLMSTFAVGALIAGLLRARGSPRSSRDRRGSRSTRKSRSL